MAQLSLFEPSKLSALEAYLERRREFLIYALANDMLYVAKALQDDIAFTEAKIKLAK